MPSYFSQVFTNVVVPPAVKRNLDFSYRHMPMLNEVSTSLSSYLASQGQISKKKNLMTWYKNTPELAGFINKIVNDTCSFYHFEPIGPQSKGSGKNRIFKANRFALENQFRQVWQAILADALVTGDGFSWLGRMSEQQIKDKMKEVLDNYSHLEMKGKVPRLEYYQKEEIRREIELELKQQTDHELEDTEKFPDEDVLAPRKFKYMPSTTVEVVYDRYDIKGYNHFLGVYLPMFFSPEEIIHFTLMKRDGKVNGYTPVESAVVQLELLRQMWQNQLALHKNGGAPDKIFNLKNLQISSPAYKRIEEQISKYRLAENKHGNMLFTGDLNVIDMQQLDEMQFKDVGLFVVGVLAMQWGIPKSSIPFIIGGTNTKDDTGGNAERGYWQWIRGLQQTYTELWNTQLWIPYFKVKIVSELSYPQMEVQEQAALQSKVQNLQNINSLLQNDKKKVAFEKKLDMLGWTEDDVEDLSEEELAMQQDQSLNMGSPKTSKDKPQTEQAAGKAGAKRQEQQNTIASRGKPTGIGKEIEEIKDSITELKGFIAGTIQKAVIHTEYENQPKLRKDEPVQQFADNNSIHDPLRDTAGPMMPADWAIDKDNKIKPDGVQMNYRDRPMFHGAQMTPQVPPQKSFAPGNMLNNSNLDNPAGNVNYSGNFQRDEGGYIANDDLEHDTPQTKPVKRKGKYPSQTKYPDEPTQFPGKDEKESQLQKGIKVEKEHQDMYKYLEKYLKEHGKLPPFEKVAELIAKDHLDELKDYYSRLQKIESFSKEHW